VALGPLASAALSELHVARVILSSGGITEKGLFNSNTLLVDCERQMLEAASDVWAVADSSKFGKSALAHLCPLSSVTRVFVDNGLSERWRQIVRDAGVDLTIVE
jgi:DeoR/GlpR family transcriptional regulator of sugar metabolism